MKVDGRCLCGSVTFEAHVDPATAAICHCTDCQQN
ncbi:MAG: GFA family protein, partial [Pseudomonadota bacterium]